MNDTFWSAQGYEQVVLTCSWIIWCTIHSVLISRKVSFWLQSLLGSFEYYFRLLFNLVSFLTLVPVVLMTAMWRGGVVFSWTGLWIVLQAVFLVTALWLFRNGAKQYDLGLMLGIRQIRLRRQQLLLAEDDYFSQKGSLGVTRHPWYLGSLMFIWSALPVYYLSSIIASSVLSVYLIIGTVLEERKLLHEYGEKYKKYQQDVSMLFPFKWIVKKMKGVK